MQVVMTTQDTSAWMDTTGQGKVRSMIHNSFSDGTSTLIGTHLAYLARVKAKTINRPFYFWSFAGDGGVTIGMGQISSFFQQGWGLLVVYDNRGYQNTGSQVSATTYPFENRSTTPVGSVIAGNQYFPRDLIRIAAAHDIPFAATASPAYPDDLMDKVRYAINVPGPTLLWIDAPCPKEQGFAENETLKVAELAVETGLFPLVRYQNGKWVIDRLRSLERTGKAVSIEEFFRVQAKGAHLSRGEFKNALKLLMQQTEERYAWFLKQAKDVPEAEKPSLYLPEGTEEPIRALDEF
jgi:pyruvate ferredoxin oxidoreductase beta subunit